MDTVSVLGTGDRACRRNGSKLGTARRTQGRVSRRVGVDGSGARRGGVAGHVLGAWLGGEAGAAWVIRRDGAHRGFAGGVCRVRGFPECTRIARALGVVWRGVCARAERGFKGRGA